MIATKRFNEKTHHSLIGAMLLSIFFFPFGETNAQNLPTQMHFSADGKRLITGGVAPGGLYDEAVVQTIELWFDQTNYWNILQNNYNSGADLGSLAIINGDTLASEVGVRFKGTTSYFQTQNSQKKIVQHYPRLDG